jgi:hypothetical protein
MKTLKFVSTGLVTFAIVGLMAFAQQEKPQHEKAAHEKVAHEKAPHKKMDGREMTAALQACAKACSDCQRACDLCATHCANMLHEGKKEHLKTLATCRDCATMCSAAAEIVARNGPFSALIAEACARACGHCAEACEAFPDDEHMKFCAEECRKCEKACNDLVKQMSRK